MQSQNSQWIYVLACLKNEDREIGGLKIWKHEWEDRGEDAVVIDPIYGETHHFGVYRMRDGEKEVEFAAGEFSNGVWGFYVRSRATTPNLGGICSFSLKRRGKHAESAKPLRTMLEQAKDSLGRIREGLRAKGEGL